MTASGNALGSAAGSAAGSASQSAVPNCEITDRIQWVEVDRWVEQLTGDHADGYHYLDLLTAIDRPAPGTPDADAVEVVAHVIDPVSGRGRWRGAVIAAENAFVPTLSTVFPAAAWHEREVREMFGVEFVGGSAAPLLHLTTYPRYPLRKSTVLAARAVRPWPGAQESSSRRASARRRTLPPGVVEGWLHDGDVPVARSEPVAESEVAADGVAAGGVAADGVAADG